MFGNVLNQIMAVFSNTSFLAWDILIVAIFFAVTVTYFYSFGRDNIIIAIISVYITGLLFTLLPYIDWFKALIKTSSDSSSVFVFILLFAFIFMILKWNGFFEPYIVPTGFEVPFFATVFCGLFISILLLPISADLISVFSLLTKTLFVGDIALSCWLLSPIGLFILLRGET